MKERKYVILNERDVKRTITRLSHEIIEKNKGTDGIILLGIPTRGRFLAKRVRDCIMEIEGVKVPTGAIDATLYRDDISRKDEQPPLKEMDIPENIDDKKIILFDDVLFTGRTIRAAMDVIMDFGRPMFIQLAVLVDRGHRELPIKADFIGKNLPTSLKEEVKVSLKECDGKDEVVIRETF